MRQPCEISEADGVPVVELFGEADLANLDELQASLSQAESTLSGTVIVSLMHAEYFDSSTIHTVLSFGERLQRTGRRLLIVGPSGDSGRRILSIFGIAAHIPVFYTLADALASGR
jgi:anti-anti-sigma factor